MCVCLRVCVTVTEGKCLTHSLYLEYIIKFRRLFLKLNCSSQWPSKQEVISETNGRQAGRLSSVGILYITLTLQITLNRFSLFSIENTSTLYRIAYLIMCLLSLLKPQHLISSNRLEKHGDKNITINNCVCFWSFTDGLFLPNTKLSLLSDYQACRFNASFTFNTKLLKNC